MSSAPKATPTADAAPPAQENVSAKSVTVFTDRAHFTREWSGALSGAGLSVLSALPSQLPKSVEQGVALVIDAGAESYDEDELLTHVGLARALGAIPVVVVPGDLDLSSIDDVLDALCDGFVARRPEDCERIAIAIARRVDTNRARRFEYVTVSPRGGELLVIFSDGHAMLLERPVGPEDDGSSIDSISLEDDATRALLVLENGQNIALTPANVALRSMSRPYGAIDGVKLGRRVRELRLAAGLTQAELARRTGIHRPNIARVEAGRHTPSLETLARLAQAIGVPTKRVIGD
jgi:DNA-binding XRE family transcriptional regulator